MAAETHTVAGTTIARHGAAVLLRGRSGQGKSDLALRALCRPLQLPGEAAPAPFQLVSDDQTVLTAVDGVVLASSPAPLRDLLEVRGIGIIDAATTSDVPLALVVDLTTTDIERLPEFPGAYATLLGLRFDVVPVAPFEAAAPEKVALALARSVACLPDRRKGNSA
ncbi:MAG: HPr kinase/phosphorylase [Hyphomicrobiaceae bacterium]